MKIITHDQTSNVSYPVGSYLTGAVIPVLKKDKGKVPSTSMLHLELYSEYDGNWIAWELNEPQPKNLLNPLKLLL